MDRLSLEFRALNVESSQEDSNLLSRPPTPTSEHVVKYSHGIALADDDDLGMPELQSIAEWVLGLPLFNQPKDEKEIRALVKDKLVTICHEETQTLCTFQRTLAIKSVMKKKFLSAAAFVRQDRTSFQFEERLGHPLYLMLNAPSMRDQLGLSEEESQECLKLLNQCYFPSMRRSNETRTFKKQRTTGPE